MDKKIKVWFEKGKKPLIVLGSLILVAVIGLLIGNSVADPNSGYLRNQSVEGLSFENAELVYENGITTFEVEVFNENESNFSLKYVNINLKDEEGKVTTLIGYVGETLEVNEAKLITASIDQDLSNSVSLEYVISK